jgi:hypothetical protein
MVDRLDADAIPQQVCSNSYQQLHKMVAKALFRWGERCLKQLHACNRLPRALLSRHFSPPACLRCGPAAASPCHA